MLILILIKFLTRRILTRSIICVGPCQCRNYLIVYVDGYLWLWFLHNYWLRFGFCDLLYWFRFHNIHDTFRFRRGKQIFFLIILPARLAPIRRYQLLLTLYAAGFLETLFLPHPTRTKLLRPSTPLRLHLPLTLIPTPTHPQLLHLLIQMTGCVKILLLHCFLFL